MHPGLFGVRDQHPALAQGGARNAVAPTHVGPAALLPDMPPTLGQLGAEPLHHGNKGFPHMLALHWVSGRACPWYIEHNGSWRQRHHVGTCWTGECFSKYHAACKRFSRLRPLWRRVYRLTHGLAGMTQHTLPGDSSIAKMLRTADDSTARDWWLWALAADVEYQRVSAAQQTSLEHFGNAACEQRVAAADRAALESARVRALLPGSTG
jgi:hypothetical protein